MICVDKGRGQVANSFRARGLRGFELLSPRGKYANARVHLSPYHAHVFPGRFRTHCRPNRIPPFATLLGPLLLPPPTPSLLPRPILQRFTSKLARSPRLIDRQVMGQFNLISKINNHSRPSCLARSIYSEIADFQKLSIVHIPIPVR